MEREYSDTFTKFFLNLKELREGALKGQLPPQVQWKVESFPSHSSQLTYAMHLPLGPGTHC